MTSEAAGTEADDRLWTQLRAFLCAGTEPHRPMWGSAAPQGCSAVAYSLLEG